MTTLFLMMGGKGTRLGGDRPKQYVEIDGKPIFAYILKACLERRELDAITIVSNKDWLDYVQDWVERMPDHHKLVRVVAGGCNRSESIKNGLLAMDDVMNEGDVALFHDATHPYLDGITLRALVEAVKENGAATMGEMTYDAVYEMNDEGYIEKALSKKNVVTGASPEGFLYGPIKNIYLQASDEELENMPSGGTIAVAHGMKMKVLEINCLNLKLTYYRDMELLQHLLTSYFFVNN